jgi:hypothetical protein
MTGAELRERMTLRWECYCDLHPRLTWREESEWWISALAGELGITREMVEALNELNGVSIDAEAGAVLDEIGAALTTLLDASEGK